LLIGALTLLLDVNHPLGIDIDTPHAALPFITSSR
jgi:hypothetical protein